jgi:cyclophilin family peptidyl-prolyl cis-trans isomerase
MHSATSLAALLLIPAVLAGQTGEKHKATTKEKAKTPMAEIGVVETSLGTFEIEFYPADAPKTVENFVKLAERKFFDGLRVHRIVPGFVIQSGDDKSKDLKNVDEWGTGGKSIYGGPFADELNPNTPSYKAGYLKGVVAMANAGPNTNTSQFFVMLADSPRMPKNYTIFGKVVKGIETIDKMGKAEIIPIRSPGDGRPKTDILIKKITIRREPAAHAPEK